jgi:steroid 5-alpha reductase family enzyme
MIGKIIETFGVELLAVVIFVTIVFVIAQRKKRFDIADIAWGLIFIVIAAVGLSYGKVTAIRPEIVTLLVGVWGLRLAVHIFSRYRLKDVEDRRYSSMRENFKGHPLLLPYVKIFLSQGLLALVISLPVTIVTSTSPGGWTLISSIGVIVWIIGFYFETIGDLQLSWFINDSSNKGKLMTSGLWKYTRHPNYFGEVTQWWGIGLIGLTVPYGWLGIIGTSTITILIIFVSGVPLLEKHYKGRLDWEAYKARTNMLFPWRPKR